MNFLNLNILWQIEFELIKDQNITSKTKKLSYIHIEPRYTSTFASVSSTFFNIAPPSKHHRKYVFFELQLVFMRNLQKFQQK